MLQLAAQVAVLEEKELLKMEVQEPLIKVMLVETIKAQV
jgi:hypothetical protein